MRNPEQMVKSKDFYLSHKEIAPWETLGNLVPYLSSGVALEVSEIIWIWSSLSKIRKLKQCKFVFIKRHSQLNAVSQPINPPKNYAFAVVKLKPLKVRNQRV